MRTLLNTINKVARFSKINIVDGNQTDVKGMENISKMPFYQSFKEGLNLTMEKQFEEANKNFQKALNQLQDKKQQLSDHYLHIYKKMITNNLTMGKIKAAEDNIYNIIKMKKKYKTQSILVYDDYNTLFQLFLKYNPEKAIRLGKALLTEKQLENMSLRHKKIFLFNLGNAYFLVGNYADAKIKYSECLESDPNHDLKVRAYNNLALACWWHKNPVVMEEGVESMKHRTQMIDSQFKQTREIFLKALQKSENPNSIQSSEEKYHLQQALNESTLDITVKFRQRTSVLPMYNLVQYYMNNEPNERMKIMFWLRNLLQLSNTSKQEKIFDQVYTTLCILSNQRHQLQEFLKMAVEKYKDKIQEIYYSKLLSVIIAQKQREAAEKYGRKAIELQQKYFNEDPYVFKRKYLSEEQLSL